MKITWKTINHNDKCYRIYFFWVAKYTWQHKRNNYI